VGDDFNEKTVVDANLAAKIREAHGDDIGDEKTGVHGTNFLNRERDAAGNPIDQAGHNFDNPAIRNRDSGFYDVGLHGDKEGIWFKENDGSWRKIDLDTLVARMEADGYQPGTPIRLLACSQGSADIINGVAHQLSAKFKAYLIAPEEPLLLSRTAGFQVTKGGGWGEYLNGKRIGRFP
jgi:hypothetical protein